LGARRTCRYCGDGLRLRRAEAGRGADEAGIIAFAREKLGGYKVPKSVRFIDEVPKSPVGKLLRRVLRDPFWGGRERRIG
jgi:fatty-acyl-CoA synthase